MSYRLIWVPISILFLKNSCLPFDSLLMIILLIGNTEFDKKINRELSSQEESRDKMMVHKNFIFLILFFTIDIKS